jgi:hypothetical protein
MRDAAALCATPGGKPDLDRPARLAVMRKVKIIVCVSRRDHDKAAVTLARVTEPSLPDMRTESPLTRRGRRAKRDRYLPSAQVLQELAILGPDLGTLAEDLRDRLSGPGDDVTDLASRPA